MFGVLFSRLRAWALAEIAGVMPAIAWPSTLPAFSLSSAAFGAIIGSESGY